MADESAISVWELRGGLRAPGAAREAVRDTLGGLVSPEVLSVVVLVTSEIVTSAVVRAGVGAVLTVEVAPGTIVVTVADERADAPALSALAQAVIEDHELSWGAHVHRSGKAVWFSVPVHDDGSSAASGAEAGTVHS